MDLKMNDLCSSLSCEFLETVEKAFLFNGNVAALFLTYMGTMFCFSSIFDNFLGVGSHYEPKKLIQVLIPKDVCIQDFDCRGSVVIALTNRGCVYQWGGDKNIPDVVTCLRDECVVQISCGETFLMALTSEGKIYAWKSTGVFNNKIYTILIKEDDMLEADISPVIVKIDGIRRPLALTEGGKIYLPAREYQEISPPFIFMSKSVGKTLKNETIIKIECGKFRLFALSAKGNLYCWNEYVVNESVTPEIILPEVGSVVDFSAPINVDEVVVKTVLGKFFRIVRRYSKSQMWHADEMKMNNFKEYQAAYYSSKYGGRDEIITPIETSMSANSPRIQWMNNLSSAFNKIEDSDVTFVVEGRMIYAHQKIIALQCSKMKEMMNDHYRDSFDRILVPVENCSYSSIYRFLKYLYTGFLDLGNHLGNMELLTLVCAYQYKPLIMLCQESVLRGMREDNACAIFHLASNLGLTDMKRESVLFVNNHLESMAKKGFYDGLTELY